MALMWNSHDNYIIPTEYKYHPYTWMIIEAVVSDKPLLLELLIEENRELCEEIAPHIRQKFVSSLL